MRNLGRKIIIVVLMLLIGICSTGCKNDNGVSLTKEKLEANVEASAFKYIEEYQKGETIVIDGKVFNFNLAFKYVNQFFGIDWQKYGQGLEEIKSALQKSNAVLAALYSDYVQAINLLSNYHKLDLFAYKTSTTRALVSKQIANDIVGLIKTLNSDKSLLELTKDIPALDLVDFNFYDSIKIENEAEKVKYLNDFSQNLVSVPYFSKRQSQRVTTFLNNYDVEVGGVSFANAAGVTYFNDNVANRVVVNEKYELFQQKVILIHEIGHVSDIPYELVAGESLANTTALLSSYHTAEFMYGDIDKLLGSKIYEQSLYAFMMNHIFGYGEEYAFRNNIYAYKEKLTEADILGAFDKELNAAASGFAEEYQIFWQFGWKNAAYNDIINMGTEYIYAALNAVYIWDLYGGEDRQIAIDKYNLLIENTVGFDKFDDIGLIGDSNIRYAYDSLKKLVVKNYNTIIEINDMLELKGANYA